MSIHVQIHAPSGNRLSQSFERMIESLQLLDGMFVELDGSFVWRDRKFTPAKQMDGMIYDRDGAIEYIDVQGTFSVDQWISLCAIACGIVPDTNWNASGVCIARMNETLRVHEPQSGKWTSVQEVVRNID